VVVSRGIVSSSVVDVVGAVSSVVVVAGRVVVGRVRVVVGCVTVGAGAVDVSSGTVRDGPGATPTSTPVVLVVVVARVSRGSVGFSDRYMRSTMATSVIARIIADRPK
jgi:hypothetical protein